ncbi:MAG: ACP S-malonyltransferase [Opitutales bacterium]|jgi:[acyl-carrier-protein] S-malonyltransferase|nr:ACP S-malonyltransferase [Opitutales bacterium]MDP4643436.1 ACP S-malonyltransferase [Opitutales bacterium]MDP4778105.1 ACP S-malonyltransferase [Opitutales bacterium]MDP4880324.1 ACP S-malonyltransferase [Opitutales bacterium]MDP4883192.1 ACP S-malonyltransferase [Opitutales bacterium]
MATGLLFSGQGAQTVGMGRSLYENSEIAKALYDEANEVLGWDLKGICFDGPDEALTETKVCQPALYVHGYAIFSILKAQGKLNDLKTACGLSLGELTALAAAGVYDFATGLRLVAERGRLMQLACDATKGGMAAVIGGTPEEVQAFCDEFDIEIANLNCPGQIVISGDNEKVLEAVAASKGRFKLCKPLNVAGAYHSRLMTSARDAFAEFIKDFDFKAPELVVYTNVTGGQISDPQAIKDALVSQVVSSVRFEENLRNMAADNAVSDFYECGPGKVLAGFAKRIDKSLVVTPISEFDELPA